MAGAKPSMVFIGILEAPAGAAGAGTVEAGGSRGRGPRPPAHRARRPPESRAFPGRTPSIVFMGSLPPPAGAGAGAGAAGAAAGSLTAPHCPQNFVPSGSGCPH